MVIKRGLKLFAIEEDCINTDGKVKYNKIINVLHVYILIVRLGWGIKSIKVFDNACHGFVRHIDQYFPQ